METRKAILWIVTIVLTASLAGSAAACKAEDPVTAFQQFFAAVKALDAETAAEFISDSYLDWAREHLIEPMAEHPDRDEYALALGAESYEDLLSWPTRRHFAAVMGLQAQHVDLDDAMGFQAASIEVMDVQTVSEDEVVLTVRTRTGNPQEEDFKEVAMKLDQDGCWRMLMEIPSPENWNR